MSEVGMSKWVDMIFGYPSLEFERPVGMMRASVGMVAPPIWGRAESNRGS
jgi:hypothetical protein